MSEVGLAFWSLAWALLLCDPNPPILCRVINKVSAIQVIPGGSTLIALKQLQVPVAHEPIRAALPVCMYGLLAAAWCIIVCGRLTLSIGFPRFVLLLFVLVVFP